MPSERILGDRPLMTLYVPDKRGGTREATVADLTFDLLRPVLGEKIAAELIHQLRRLAVFDAGGHGVHRCGPDDDGAPTCPMCDGGAVSRHATSSGYDVAWLECSVCGARNEEDTGWVR